MGKFVMKCLTCGMVVMDGNEPRRVGCAIPSRCSNPDCPSNKPEKTRDEIIYEATTGLVKFLEEGLKRISIKIEEMKGN